jgi:pimeloyl-ACP methyl ester carboxylesterase
MESMTHHFEGHEVHSLRFGSGPNLLIAFHGYADRARLFAPLAPVLSQKYTCIALDLPFHGQTKWLKSSFTRKDILAIVEMYKKEQNVQTITLLGYSFGARIVLALLPDVITYTDRIFLLAPDGIATRGMRSAIYTPMWMRKLAYRLMRKPNWFIALMRLLKSAHLLSPFIWMFIEKNLLTPDRYRRTFGMWFALDDFWLRRRTIRKLLNSHPVPVDLFFGRKDVFVKYKKVKKLAQKVEQVQLHLLNTGHRIIGPALVEKLGQLLNKPKE